MFAARLWRAKSSRGRGSIGFACALGATHALILTAAPGRKSGLSVLRILVGEMRAMKDEHQSKCKSFVPRP